MKVVSVINYKGGVGKTSLTSNLGAQLAWGGRRVLMIDLDAQASLTFSFIAPDIWEKQFSQAKTIKSWFESFESGKPISLASLVDTPQRVQSFLQGRGCLDLIYSHLGLINVDLELATKLGGANIAQAKKNFISIHRRLAEGIAADLSGKHYDLTLVDCPPNFNIVTKTAIIASDYILVPARPDYLSTLGIDYLLRSVNQLVKGLQRLCGSKGRSEYGHDCSQNPRSGLHDDSGIWGAADLRAAALYQSGEEEHSRRYGFPRLYQTERHPFR